MTKLATIVAAFTCCALAPLTAHAESAAEAFARGQSAFKAGRVHEACLAFEASEQLEAKVDTELALATCDEQDGKPVAAALIYNQLAQTDPNLDRRKTSAAKAAALSAKAPKLRITLSQRPEGLVIKVDGTEVPATGDVFVDAGPHEVVVTAPGFEGHAHAAVDRDRQIVDVIVRMEPKAEQAPPAPAAPVPATQPSPPPTTTTTTAAASVTVVPPAPSHSSHKRNGIILGASGVVLVVASVILVDSAYSQFNDESSLCPHSRCATQADLNSAHNDLNNGHTLRDIGYPVGIVGIAAIGVGAYMLFGMHDEQPRVGLDIGHDHAGLAWTSHF
jgi:hypothetical protein